MIRVIKPEGFGNIRLQEAPIQEIAERHVLVRTEATLISRGSELFRRYIKDEDVPQRTTWATRWPAASSGSAPRSPSTGSGSGSS